jgi:lipopolysaccharide export system protein LptA
MSYVKALIKFKLKLKWYKSEAEKSQNKIYLHVSALSPISFVIWVLASGVFLFSYSRSYAENATGKNEKPTIKITANRMETYNEKNIVSFLENVIARRGDMTIYANRLDVYTDKGQKKLVKIIAEGNVKIEKGGKVATGARAEYYDEEQKLILKGNPQLREKDNLIEGGEITYYIKEENILVQSNEKKRVEVTLFP